MDSSPSKALESAATGNGDRGTNDPERVAKILSFVEKRRKMQEQSATKMTSLNVSDAWYDKLYDKMRCQDQSCGMIPHPSRRYMCPRGHFYCAQCFNKRAVSNGMRSSSDGTQRRATCGYQMSPGLLDRVGYGYGCIPPNTVLTDADKQRLGKEQTTGVCTMEVQSVPESDPLYSQLFRNTVWRCPFVAKSKDEEVWCTSKGVPGWNIANHIKSCLEKEYFTKK